MREALPVITEDVEPLKQRFQCEHDRRKRPRRQMLDLLSSGPALSQARSLEALLALHGPAAKSLSLLPDVLAAIAQARRHPAGLASYAALRQWVQQTSQLDVYDHPL
jgi:hypothetical protein